MRSILFHVPTALPWSDGVIALFGPLGLVTLSGLGIVLVWFALVTARQGVQSAWAQLWLPVVAIAALFGFVLPMIAEPAGVPVRGYGVMLLVAATCGTWLSIVRARRHGIDADTILGLATQVFIWGIVGARLFYVIQYHDRFFGAGKPVMQTLLDVVNIAGGGLVVFGSLPTAAIAAWLFARRHKLDILTLADTIAPGMLVGLAIGRVGCFLNGCCYGGPCDLPWAVTFPAGTEVAIKFPAESGGAGLEAGSVPVHPAQLYAAIDAGLLAWLAVAWTPFARRTGEVFALVLTLHPISRMLLEAIRVDEPPALGTPFSISQLISLVLMATAAALWWWIGRPGSAQIGRPPPGGTL
jgi:phosphatidylglycerol:prolipoprotein diacylglycerol transferase